MVDAIEIDKEDQTCEYTVERTEETTDISQIVKEGIRASSVFVVVLSVHENDTCLRDILLTWF